MHEPLWEAIEKNDLEAASLYLSQNERYSEEQNVLGGPGQSMIDLAVQLGHTEMLMQLLEKTGATKDLHNIYDKSKHKHTFASKVSIKENLLQDILFPKFKSRYASATVLSYLNYEEEILDQLQKLSHGSRAYLVNADGLNSFLINGNKVLQERFDTLIDEYFSED